MPASVAAAIRDAYSGGPVAVRSSATAEDLPELSFAGQHDSFLNVTGVDAVLDAVRRCWDSLGTERAVEYRARNGITDVEMAVVVQELVSADAAGVLFTANPLTGARDELVVNAAWGLGEAVVGGLVTPDTYVLPRRRADLYDATGNHRPMGTDITGFGGAAGVVEGTARVITGLEHATTLRPGEILVTTVTNIGWTPLFPRAAAVVTDVGAPLSHAAIVARELGIPAVVGCGNATTRIHTGDRVRVDGARGTVTVFAAAEH
jgi:phosphoenolpyruvate synthase/pyruvate phosphate dikinase